MLKNKTFFRFIVEIIYLIIIKQNLQKTFSLQIWPQRGEESKSARIYSRIPRWLKAPAYFNACTRSLTNTHAISNRDDSGSLILRWSHDSHDSMLRKLIFIFAYNLTHRSGIIHSIKNHWNSRLPRRVYARKKNDMS